MPETVAYGKSAFSERPEAYDSAKNFNFAT